MTNFTVHKVLGNIMLPSGDVLPEGEFVNRLCRCGFDGKFSAKVLRQMSEGGKWLLSLTPQQVSLITR